MSRETYVWNNGNFILKAKDGELTQEYMGLGQVTKSGLFVISDDLGSKGVLNHADGKMYDSKSQYRQALRAKGCREVGNDYNNASYKTPIERGIRGNFNVRPQLKQAIEKVFGC